MPLVGFGEGWAKVGRRLIVRQVRVTPIRYVRTSMRGGGRAVAAVGGLRQS